MSVTDTATNVKTVKPRRAVLEMPEYHPPLAGRDGVAAGLQREYVCAFAAR